MSDIGPINSPSATPYIPADALRQNAGRAESAGARSTPDADRVELSEHARLLSRALDLPEVRVDLVQSIRSELASGSYETPDKLDVAAESLLRDLDLFG